MISSKLIPTARSRDGGKNKIKKRNIYLPDISVCKTKNFTDSGLHKIQHSSLVCCRGLAVLYFLSLMRDTGTDMVINMTSGSGAPQVPGFGLSDSKYRRHTDPYSGDDQKQITRSK